MKLARSALLGAASLALGSAYGAGNKAKDNDPGFNALDKNHDGYLSKTEAKGNPYLGRKFKTADKNHDGKLSRTEYLAVMTKHDLRTAKEKVSHMIQSKGSSSSVGGTSSTHK